MDFPFERGLYSNNKKSRMTGKAHSWRSFFYSALHSGIDDKSTLTPASKALPEWLYSQNIPFRSCKSTADFKHLFVHHTARAVKGKLRESGISSEKLLY